MKQLILIDTDETATERVGGISGFDGIARVSVISTASQLAACMQNVGSTSGICLADIRLLEEKATLEACVSQSSPSTSRLYPVKRGDEILTYGSLEADCLINAVTLPEQAPAVLLEIPASAINSELEIPVFETAAEAIMLMAIGLLGNGYSIDMSAEPLVISDTVSAERWMFSDAARARLLAFAVNAVNIEELFPNNAWEEHEEESAAACFHTLAAYFIKYGDLATAEECLSFSDRLEDSPRSLALRGLISRRNGETLGAVANLVSSLQQYETRKRTTEMQHYISFAPVDLEVINTSLHSGLSALNKQENDAAFSHFATAIFNFDSFYAEVGMDSVE